MKSANFMAFSAIISLGALSGCSSLERTLVFPAQQEELEIQPYDTSTHKNSIHIFTPIDISEKIAARQQKKKITHIDIAIDETTAYPKQIRNTPENIYREEILRRLIYSIPGNGPSVTIWSIGSIHKNYKLQHPNQLDIGQQHIATNIFHQGIDKIAEELTARKKPAALVVIKEFSSITESDENAIDRLRQRMKSPKGLSIGMGESHWLGSDQGICIYSVGPTNHFSSSKIERADECGFSITADHLAQGRNANHMIEEMIYSAPIDTDMDGIPDYKDQCNKTPARSIVNHEGCSLIQK